MKRVFWSFFFILLSFSVNIGQSSVNLLPTFIGFGLLFSAAMRLEEESPLFRPVRQWSTGLCIYYAIIWLTDIFLPIPRDGSTLSSVLTVLDAAALLLTLYVARLVINAIANMEMRRNAALGSIPLRAAWKAIVLCAILSLVLIPVVFLFPSVAVTASLCVGVAQFLAILFFLVRLWRVGKNYEEVISLQNNR